MMDYGRPFLYITISLILGIIMGMYINLNLFFIFIMLCVSILFFLLLYLGSFKIYYKVLSILISFFLLGMVVITFVNSQENEYVHFDEKEINLYGTVETYINQEAEISQFILKPHSLEYQGNMVKVNHKIKITVYGKSQLYKYGDILKIRGTLVLPKAARNPGGFNYQLYLKINGINALIYTDASNVQKVGKVKTSILKNLVYNLDSGIKHVYYATMSRREAGVLTSMIIGDRSGLEEDIQEDFVKSGVMHILAISGFNIAVILYFANFLLSQVKSGLKYLFLIILVVFYAIMAGGSPSVTRAALMAVIYLIGKMIGRNSDPLNSLSLSAFIILLINPLMLFDIGFQLSYMATLSLIIFYPIIMKKMPMFIPNKISEIVAGSISSQLIIVPLFTNYFYGVSLVSIFTNLIVIPLSSLLIPLGLLSGFLGFLNLKLAFIINLINSNIIRVIIYITDAFSTLNFAYFGFYMTPLLIFGYYLILIMFLFKPNKTIKKLTAVFLIFIVLFFVFSSFKKEYMEITFLDVGQGDSIFIKTPGNRNVLIDGGGIPDYKESSFDTGQSILIPFLYKNGVKGIDVLVLTHSHDDHLKGLISVLDEMRVNMVFTGPYNQKSEQYDKFLQSIRKKNIDFKYLRKGDKIVLDEGLYVYVLNPGDKPFVNTSSDMNNNSLVLKIVYRDISLLLTGDIEREAEDELLKSDVFLDSDIIKVAHHGSAFSSSPSFIEKVSPIISVIEVGYNNYGQPDDDVVRRLEAISTVFRTDKDGAVMLKTDGHFIYAETYLSKKKFKFVANKESGE